MRTNLLKAIIFMIMVALCGMSANAQGVNSNVNTSDAKACWEYLVKKPKDTIVSSVGYQNQENKYVVRRVVFLLEGKLTARQDTTLYRPVAKTVKTVAPAVKDSLYKASVETRFAEKLYNEKKRDTYYAYSDSVNGVSPKDPDAGKVVLRGADKYGWGVNVFAGYQLAEHVNSPVIGAGVEYTRSWWGIYLNGEAGYSKYTSNAIKAGEKYWSFRAESSLMIQPFRLDPFNQNRLFFFGGIGFESYETDSKTYENPETGKKSDYKSWGNYMYPTAGIRFEHRFFTTGNSLYMAAQWRGLEGVIQNSGSEKYNAFMFSVGFNFGIFRNKVANMNLKEVRALTK